MATPQNKTQPTRRPIEDFLSTLDEQKRSDSRVLIDMMQQVSGHSPVMWGPSIIGFGTVHYKYESGREGDMPAIGFSPRKTSLTLYINSEGFDKYSEYLDRLGPHTTSVSCLYIKRLADVDQQVLREMITHCFEQTTAQSKQKAQSVEEYIASVPDSAREQFDRLRSIVRQQLPDAAEVVRYGIVGYKTDKKRAVVYISGWKDHVALYPTPKNPVLKNELSLYIKGKGTLWFSLVEPLPTELIRRVVASLLKESS